MSSLGEGRHSRKSDERQGIVWALLTVLMITLCVSWGVFASCIAQLEAGTEGLNAIEYISSGTQRLVKLELTGSPNDELIFNLSNTIYDLMSMDGEESVYFGAHEDIIKGISDMATDWEVVQDSVEAFRVDGDADGLLASSERHFYHTADLANNTLDYISELSDKIVSLQVVLMAQLAIIALIIGSRFFVAFMEIKRNREMAHSMFIDVSTGLFNRSKCQEILRNQITTGDNKTRAMVVFDLNDLKKTNDAHGHRVGDDLIYNFAQIIKNATKIFNYEVFVGRYGGDEFIVYYNSIEHFELNLYLEEVAFLAEAFNEAEQRYQISYAQGHAALGSMNESFTMRQLFDEADRKMYINKMEIKKKRAENGEYSIR